MGNIKSCRNSNFIECKTGIIEAGAENLDRDRCSKVDDIISGWTVCCVNSGLNMFIKIIKMDDILNLPQKKNLGLPLGWG